MEKENRLVISRSLELSIGVNKIKYIKGIIMEIVIIIIIISIIVIIIDLLIVR